MKSLFCQHQGCTGHRLEDCDSEHDFQRAPGVDSYDCSTSAVIRLLLVKLITRQDGRKPYAMCRLFKTLFEVYNFTFSVNTIDKSKTMCNSHINSIPTEPPFKFLDSEEL